MSELLFNFMPGDIDPQLEQTERDASLVCDDKAVRRGLQTSDQDREVAAGSDYEWRTRSRAPRSGLRLVKRTHNACWRLQNIVRRREVAVGGLQLTLQRVAAQHVQCR